MHPEDSDHSAHTAHRASSREAAIKLARAQLDALFDIQSKGPVTEQHHHKPAVHHKVQPEAPKQVQTPVATVAKSQPTPQIQADQWQQYHTAWQDYYQKYYAHYYSGQVKQALDQHAKANATPKERKEEAMHDLRSRLRGKVKKSATKVRGSRHFIPAIAAFCVVLVFAFLQYNGILIGTVEAYVSPGAIDPQNLVVDPTTDITVSADPRLIIPELNIDVPMVYGAANDHDSMMAAMQNGVAHFAIPGASSVPGQKGNAVFSGHSSNDLFEAGNYKFIFSQLNKLKVGDPFYVNYQSKRYTYAVTGQKIVQPTDVSVLLGTNDKPILTLITCWPIGTANQRIILSAEQISPDPSTATAAPDSASSSNSAMPGNGATVLDKLFGNNGN